MGINTNSRKKRHFKSFYNDNGVTLTKAGVKESAKVNNILKKIYNEWLDEGYSPSECREMLLTGVWLTSTIENAMRS